MIIIHGLALIETALAQDILDCISKLGAMHADHTVHRACARGGELVAIFCYILFEPPTQPSLIDHLTGCVLIETTRIDNDCLGRVTITIIRRPNTLSDERGTLTKMTDLDKGLGRRVIEMTDKMKGVICEFIRGQRIDRIVGHDFIKVFKRQWCTIRTKLSLLVVLKDLVDRELMVLLGVLLGLIVKTFGVDKGEHIVY